MQLYGADISEFQGAINWDQLNSAANFVIMRATYGTVVDQVFARNQSEARRVRAAAGPLGVGYYHFAYPTLLDPGVSAAFFVQTLGPLQAGEIMVLDLEGSIGPDPVAWSGDWLLQVERLTGVKPLIYLNQSEEQAYDWSPVVRNGYGLWLAKYDGNKVSVPTATHWPLVALKQWTDVDKVIGISGNVDGDTFQGDFSQFYAYGYKPPVASPAPPPAPAPQPTPPPVSQPSPPEPQPQPTPTLPPETPPITMPTPTPPPIITSKPRLTWWQKLVAWFKGL
jgi:lysozyme